MSLSPLIDQLVSALRCLPGVGPKSGQRIAFQLLERDREGARKLAAALLDAADHVGYCRHCRILTEEAECTICANPKRTGDQICVVESPADVMAMESAQAYRGRYFVLMGHLSPLDGIGPRELGLELLAQRLDAGGVSEVILATNPTVEGEATAHYVGEMARERGIRATRIAHGVPLGGELEYIDGRTLSHAFEGRREL